jgi:hypothetical protein
MRPPAWEKFLVFLNRHLFSVFAGVTAGDWLKILWDNHFDVDLHRLPRAMVTTLASLSNSLTALREKWLYGPRVAAAVVQPPLFILGYYRSGTTHLHNLLAVDPRFAYPNTYQVVFPHTFLTTEAASSHFYNLSLPEHRLQDNVRMTMGTPQEDEFALCVSTGLSPYMGWMFPRRGAFYDRYLTFRGVHEEEIARWKAALVHFVKKLSWKYGRPLLLKSPPHMCRIKLLLELFPQARFVHIHREPYTVFRSNRGLIVRVLSHLGLQDPSLRDLDDRILRQYRLMYDVFFAERDFIPPGQYHEVAFEELERDPLEQMRTLYERLGLPEFAGVQAALEEYTRSLAGYKKNRHPPLAETLRRRIAAEWRPCFEAWGYEGG